MVYPDIRAVVMISTRPLQSADNPALASIIRNVLMEFGIAGPGFACNDPETDSMYETYLPQGSCYLVLEQDGKVLGGAGIAALKGGERGICELQKMYLLPEGRGRGQGRVLITTLLTEAEQLGYRYCYLETMTAMTDAHRLYEKVGFIRLAASPGDTGHYGCNIWYGRQLTQPTTSDKPNT